MPQFGLINMNARLYEPLVARMLSPYAYINGAFSSQAHNRYSYAGNNPLKYTDPTGDFFWIPIAIGAYIGAVSGSITAQKYGHPWYQGALWGGLIGGATGYLGTLAPFGTSWIGSVAYGAALGSVSAGASTYAVTGNWELAKRSAIWGGIGGALSGFIGSEEFGNIIRGEGFRSNEMVFSDFVKDDDYQGALDYFGVSGNYTTDQNILQGSPGATDTHTGEMYFGDYTFSKNYDHFRLIADHEERHSAGVLDAIKKGRLNTRLYIQQSDPTKYYENYEEYNVYKYNYTRQGLYPNSGVNIIRNINGYGVQIGRAQFSNEWWHFLYKIQRRW